MRHGRFLSVILVVICLGRVQATTWIIEHDPEQPVNQIGTVVDGAASGDTILVGSGLYYEHILVPDMSITFLSQEGSNATVLDGSQEVEGRTGAIIYRSGTSHADLILDGLTLQNGTGGYDQFGNLAGGALCWWGDSNKNSRVEITNCRFESNNAWGYDLAVGAAIFLFRFSEIIIRDCHFEGNRAMVSGSVHASSIESGIIENCDFLIRETELESFGSELALSQISNLMVRDNYFHSDIQQPFERKSLGISSRHAVITGNHFEDHGTLAATRMVFSNCCDVDDPPYYLDFTDNFIWNNGDPPDSDEWRITILAPVFHATIARNTIIGTSIHWGTNTGYIICNNNLFYKSPVLLHASTHNVLSCNNAWPDTITTSNWGNYTFVDNISQDPLFCDPESGDFHIAFQSPCAPDNSPSGCELIGLYGPACDITPTRKTTWGNIKLRYKK